MRHVDPITPARSTTVPRTTTRRTGYSKPAAQDYIDALIPFNAGSLYASHTSYPNTGRLPSGWADLLDADARQARNDSHTLYVVYSYATPIGWVRHDGTAVVPAVKYSNTTSRHQHATRMGLDIWDGDKWANNYISELPV